MKVYYPAMLDLNNKSCVVIGGGKVAERKITSLIKANAKVTVISPEATANIEGLAKENKVILQHKQYEKGDLIGFFIIIIATNDNKLNKSIYQDADHTYQLVNIIDEPDLCSFIVPSSFQRGHLQIAISTHGASPGLAKRVREQLEDTFGYEYEKYTEFLANMRKYILDQQITEQQKRFYLKEILEPNWLEAIKQEGLMQVQIMCKQMINEGSMINEKDSNRL